MIPVCTFYLFSASGLPLCVLVGAYGIGEVVTPVLDYLGCLYSSAADSDKPQEGSSELPREQQQALPAEAEGGSSTAGGARSARQAELLSLYRRVLDGHGAAPGP